MAGHKATQSITSSWGVLPLPHSCDLQGMTAMARIHHIDLIVLEATGNQEVDVWLLPDTADLVGDLKWMRKHGWDARIVERSQQQQPILAAGAGLDMLAEALIDAQSLDGNLPGLGILALSAFHQPKHVDRLDELHLPELQGAWASLSGYSGSVSGAVSAYVLRQDMQRAQLSGAHDLCQGQVWSSSTGHVLGFAHGVVLQDRHWWARIEKMA